MSVSIYRVNQSCFQICVSIDNLMELSTCLPISAIYRVAQVIFSTPVTTLNLNSLGAKAHKILI